MLSFQEEDRIARKELVVLKEKLIQRDTSTVRQYEKHMK